MFVHQYLSWIERLYRRVHGETPSTALVADHGRSVDVVIAPREIVQPLDAGPRTAEHWRTLLKPGQQVVVNWDAEDGRPGAVVVHGEVRLTFEDTVWIWLDRELSDAERPSTGQAIQLLSPREDA